MWELSTGRFQFQRSLDTQEGRRGGVSSLVVNEGYDSSGNGGGQDGWDCACNGGCSCKAICCRSLLIGLACGRIQEWNLGEWV